MSREYRDMSSLAISSLNVAPVASMNSATAADGVVNAVGSDDADRLSGAVETHGVTWSHPVSGRLVPVLRALVSLCSVRPMGGHSTMFFILNLATDRLVSVLRVFVPLCSVHPVSGRLVSLLLILCSIKNINRPRLPRGVFQPEHLPGAATITKGQFRNGGFREFPGLVIHRPVSGSLLAAEASGEGQKRKGGAFS